MAFTVPPVSPPSPLFSHPPPPPLTLPLPSPPPPLPLPLPSLYFSSFPLISLHILPVEEEVENKVENGEYMSKTTVFLLSNLNVDYR